jgi:hypothetical protein
MRLGGIDDVAILIEPVGDQCLDQRCRMLTVAVDEQHRAAASMIEPGQQRRLLAEIARQRNHLHVNCGRRKLARNGERAIATAVVDIDRLAGKRAGFTKPLCHLYEPRVQAFKRRRLVVERHYDREPLRGGIRRLPVARQRRDFGVRSGHLFAPGASLIAASARYRHAA